MKDFSTYKPREVEAYLRQVILDAHGDAVENNAVVIARKGYYTVSIDIKGAYYGFNNFRKKDAGKIAKAIKALC